MRSDSNSFAELDIKAAFYVEARPKGAVTTPQEALRRATGLVNRIPALAMKAALQQGKVSKRSAKAEAKLGGKVAPRSVLPLFENIGDRNHPPRLQQKGHVNPKS